MIEIESCDIDFLENDFLSMNEIKKDLEHCELKELFKHVTPNPLMNIFHYFLQI